MHCPLCSHENTKVNDSRVSSDGLSVKRRRECVKCGYRFSTVEEGEIFDTQILKRNGKKELYNKEKLIHGLERALEKRDITTESLHALVKRIERDIQKLKKDEVSSEEIGKIVMDHLKKFDQVAYIRFASVYMSFEDVTGFQKEVQNLNN